MSKSRSFSIYLLKPDVNAEEALKDDSPLQLVEADNLPPSGELYVLDNPPSPPWWKGYFQIGMHLQQTLKAAVLFLEVEGRRFAITFGHVHHNLNDDCYEHDFGLRVTLNSVDPDQLKSTDALEPGTARRLRTQLPVGADITFFELDNDSSVLKRLTGIVREEYSQLFRHPTGAASLRISSSVQPDELEPLCEQIIELYESNEFEGTFPDIGNVSPITDPTKVRELDDAMIQSLRRQDEIFHLAIPDIINYEEAAYAKFSGLGKSPEYSDLSIINYYEYLSNGGFDISQIEIENVKNHRVSYYSESGQKRDNFSIYACMIFDVPDSDSGGVCHLNEGKWYLVSEDHIQKMASVVDPAFCESDLPEFNDAREADYNSRASNVLPRAVCLDRTNVAPVGQTAVEPCDILGVSGDRLRFYHIKISTVSQRLSHLFNQGVNSIIILRVSEESRQKLHHLVQERSGTDFADVVIDMFDGSGATVTYGIVTHKNPALKSESLPVFSRISLYRAVNEFRSMGVDVEVCLVSDRRP